MWYYIIYSYGKVDIKFGNKRGTFHSTFIFYILFFLNDDISNIQQSFQDGVDTLYNKCVSCGWTPSNKTPTAIVEAIQGIYGNRYTEGYNNGYNAGQSAASVSFIDVYSSQGNFARYDNYGVEGSVRFDPPSTPVNKSLKGVYIKSIYITNTNHRFGYGTFELLNSGGVYYIISRDCHWSSGGSSVNGTVTFIYG